MRGRCLALIILLLLGTTTTTLLLFLREAPDIEQTIYKSPERCCDYAANKEMLDWFRGFFGPGTSEYCRHDFPKASIPKAKYKGSFVSLLSAPNSAEQSHSCRYGQTLWTASWTVP